MPKDVSKYLRQRTVQAKTAAAPAHDDPANQSLDREWDAQFNIATHKEDIVLVSVNKLRPYSKHPFKPYGDERISSLADSIQRDGLQQPIIVRIVDGKHGWEILAGHNRAEAVKRLGWQDIPAIVREYNDEQAALVVVNTNLEQREKLLPSEKAFAYKLQMEALKGGINAIIQNGGLPSDSNGLGAGVQIESETRFRDIAAEIQGVSCSEMQRYIRLTHLTPAWLDLLDQETVPVMAGYELSFLDTDAQQEAHRYFFESGAKDKPTIKHAEAIRTAFDVGQSVTVDTIPGILHKPKKKPGPVTYRFSQKELRKQYTLPDGFDPIAFLHEKLTEAFGKAK